MTLKKASTASESVREEERKLMLRKQNEKILTRGGIFGENEENDKEQENKYFQFFKKEKIEINLTKIIFRKRNRLKQIISLCGHMN